jgi:uncharacterized membrane protein YcaP (DUF421 family)
MRKLLQQIKRELKTAKHCAVYEEELSLEEDMRLDAQTDDLSKIQVARLERSGDISFIQANGARQQAA